MTAFSFVRKLPKNSQWILEFTQGSNSAHLFRVKKTIIRKRTPFQTVEIVELFHYGKTLFLDERLQVSEFDEFLYHEAIAHPALICHPKPERVLIIGGADGGTARQVLKHKSIKKLFLVDIDAQLIKLCQKFLPEIHRSVFKSPKLKVISADGRKFLEETKEKFDVIISDLTAPLREPPSYLLFTEKFYQIVHEKLSKDGLFSLQADGVNHLNNKNFAAIHKTVTRIFPIARPLSVFIPSYDDSWGFIVASKKYDPVLLKPSDIKMRIKNRGLRGLKFYDEKIHQSLFTLPKNIQTAIRKQKKIIRDKNPIVSMQ